jgi:hypothetical protein
VPGSSRRRSTRLRALARDQARVSRHVTAERELVRLPSQLRVMRRQRPVFAISATYGK